MRRYWLQIVLTFSIVTVVRDAGCEVSMKYSWTDLVLVFSFFSIDAEEVKWKIMPDVVGVKRDDWQNLWSHTQCVLYFMFFLNSSHFVF